VTASVVIVNYRTPDLSERAARSALADGATEVIVVDNASGDDSVEHLRAIADERVHVVANPTNAGFGTGANAGARVATGDVLVFLNSDASVRPGSLASMAFAVEDAGSRAIVGPRLVGEDGEIQRSAGLVPKPDDLLIRGLGLHHLGRAIGSLPVIGRIVGRHRISAEYHQAIEATEPIDVTMVSGACMAIGRAAFEKLGGFDERYFMYFEDADLCRRAARAGWPVRYLPGAVVDHVGGASSVGDYRFGPWHAASMIRYLRDWHGATGVASGLAILWLRAVGQVVTLRSTAGRSVAALRAGLSVAATRS